MLCRSALEKRRSVTILADNSHVYCFWFVPLGDGDNFFAAMIRDVEGDRIIYRIEDPYTQSYYVLPRGTMPIKDFRRRFNLTVETFSAEAHAPMEYLPVDGNIARALDIIEKQPWGEQVLPT